MLHTSPLYAEHPTHSSGVRILGFPKEGRLETDGTGHYAELMKELLYEAGYVDEMVTAPIKRAMRIFNLSKDICMMPVAKEVLLMRFPSLKPDDVIEGVPIDYVTGHLVTRAGTKAITDPRAIEGQTLGAWSGLNTRSFIPGVTFAMLGTESEISAMQMLQNGRVDVIWGWIPDTYILSEQLGIEGLVFDPDSPIIGSATHIACKRTEKTEKLLPRLDDAMDTLRADGRLKKILGKHARVVGVDVPMTIRSHWYSSNK